VDLIPRGTEAPCEPIPFLGIVHVCPNKKPPSR
jgi:hypothetical protein